MVDSKEYMSHQDTIEHMARETGIPRHEIEEFVIHGQEELINPDDEIELLREDTPTSRRQTKMVSLCHQMLVQFDLMQYENDPDELKRILVERYREAAPESEVRQYIVRAIFQHCY